MKRWLFVTTCLFLFAASDACTNEHDPGDAPTSTATATATVGASADAIVATEVQPGVDTSACTDNYPTDCEACVHNLESQGGGRTFASYQIGPDPSPHCGSVGCYLNGLYSDGSGGIGVPCACSCAQQTGASTATGTSAQSP